MRSRVLPLLLIAVAGLGAEAPVAPAGPDLSALGPARKAVVLPPPRYPALILPAPAPARLAACVPELASAPVDGRLVVATSNETARAAIAGSWALVRRAQDALVWGTDAAGQAILVPVEQGLNHLDREGRLVDGYAAPRTFARAGVGGPSLPGPVAIPDHLSLDSFFIAEEGTAFVDLAFGEGGALDAGHVFWRADTAGQALGHLDLGGYVVIRGGPFCRAGRCVVAGEPRYTRDHTEHAWMLGPGAEAVELILSPGDAWEAQTLVVGGVFYDLFVTEQGLHIARWDGQGWRAVGRIGEVARFSAAADGAALRLAWVPPEGPWRAGLLEGDHIGEVVALGGTSEADEVILAPGPEGLSLAVVTRHSENLYGPFPRDLTIVHHLAARLGWLGPDGEVSLAAPIALAGEHWPRSLVVAPFTQAGRTSWFVQGVEGPARLLRPEGCGRP
ncbi:MAG: hypothetical protein ABIO70_17230 [Pseudomonadota bacterium]